MGGVVRSVKCVSGGQAFQGGFPFLSCVAMSAGSSDSGVQYTVVLEPLPKGAGYPNSKYALSGEVPM